MFSGCEDHQTSADMVISNAATGACSFAWISTMMANRMQLSYKELLYQMREILIQNQRSIIQCPQMTTNIKDFDFERPVYI